MSLPTSLTGDFKMDYEVKGVNTQKAVISLVVHALNSDDARRHAEAQGYAILSVRPRRVFLPLAPPSPRFSVALFSQELRTLLKAGLPLVDAIEALAEKEAGVAKTIIEKIIAFLYEGQTLSQALGRLPAIFPHLYISMIRASERTGDLSDALQRYVVYRNQVDLLRKKVVSASLYPAVLMLVGFLVMIFLMFYVVPRFSLIYADLGSKLPLLTRLLMSWGQLLHAHSTEVAAAFLTCILPIIYGFSRLEVRRAIAGMFWRIPAVGQRMRTHHLARFYRTLGMLLRGGIPLMQALTMTEDLLPASLRPSLNSVTQTIRQGGSLSLAIESHGLATPIALRLIAVGEHSGQMGDMLEKVAQFHDEELTRWVDGFLKLFEPLLMAIMGILIGTIVVLMYMPVFELAGSLQ